MNQPGNGDQGFDPGNGFPIADIESVSENRDQDTGQSNRVNLVSWAVAAAMVISSLAALVTAIKA
ncbi:hypothetical protein [Streptomyces sp. NBC_00038]|uniref:hypothetical protein n=1 Tax=Streptomyces sp. NBC_00038 TaxID=2903615 RepID=UPI002255570F|nr:hypothetical protein [Streptomyces sp. NBC_00038]MCX5557353.1 hypothetical protein [Streptomyces sp. NBC_00038]